MSAVGDWLGRIVRSIRQSGQASGEALFGAWWLNHEVEQLLKPPGQRPLIVSPRPGDEVMAMGGTMALYAKNNTTVRVITMTAGRRGTASGRQSRALGDKRRREQQAGFEAIGGVIRPTWLDLDEPFAPENRVSVELLDIVADINPDIIYMPWVGDGDSVNRSTVAVLRETISRFPKSRQRDLWVACYELATPLVATALVHCDDVLAKKRRAIECHESQLLRRDYIGALIGLNQYRGAIAGFGSSAEAFFIGKADQFLTLHFAPSTPVAEMVESNRGAKTGIL